VFVAFGIQHAKRIRRIVLPFMVCPAVHLSTLSDGGTAVAQWLRYCAINRKVAGSIPDGVIGIFH